LAGKLRDLGDLDAFEEVGLSCLSHYGMTVLFLISGKDPKSRKIFLIFLRAYSFIDAHSSKIKNCKNTFNYCSFT